MKHDMNTASTTRIHPVQTHTIEMLGRTPPEHSTAPITHGPNVPATLLYDWGQNLFTTSVSIKYT